MKKSASKAWRDIGERAALDPRGWDFKARQFFTSAQYLLSAFDEGLKNKRYDTIMHMVTAQFLLAVALELICKAVYLKSNTVSAEQLYRHDTWKYLNAGLLNGAQKQLLAHAQEHVEWAGRYPTPKWTTEKQKERFDADEVMVGGVAGIDGRSIPNTSSRDKCEELSTLFMHLHKAYEQPGA